MDEGYDIVSGWRRSRKDSIGRVIPSFVANKLVSWVSGVQLHDYGCTLKAYRSEVLQGLHLYGDLHRFIPALASSFGVRVAEIEVTHHPRRFGRSKYGITRTFKVIVDLLTLKLLLTYGSRPMRIFGALGFLSLCFGFMCGFATVLMKLLLAIDMTGNPLLFATMLGIIGGIQFLGLGFLGEINIRTYYEAQRKPIYVVREIVQQEQPK